MYRISLKQVKSVSRPLQQFIRLNSINHKINTESFVYKYLNTPPKTIKFTNEHEWLTVHNDDTGFIGITNYAADALGDATFIELPEVGEKFNIGDSIGSVESVKSASEIYTPVEGEVIAVNDKLSGSPQLINEDPMGEGWLVQLKLKDADLKDVVLMDETEYEEFLEH